MFRGTYFSENLVHSSTGGRVGFGEIPDEIHSWNWISAVLLRRIVQSIVAWLSISNTSCCGGYEAKANQVFIAIVDPISDVWTILITL